MPRHKRPAMRFEPKPLERFESREMLSQVPVPSQLSPWSAALLRAQQPPTAERRLLTLAHPNVVAAVSANKGSGGGPPASALTPAQTRHIYGFDQIANLGQGETIAIVDAYDDPNIFSDADTLDKQFTTTLGGTTTYYSAYGASSTWLSKAYSQGSKPASNASWAQEISLDVEWAHAIAPQAKIVLVETANNSIANLLAGDSYAAGTVHAQVVSNSWGGGESSSETSNDGVFTATPGVTFVFSSGDNGSQEYPAESPNVVSVGGTTLSHDASYNWTGETGWSGSGGGLSSTEASPSYQSGLGYSKRAAPDLAYDADPNTGFAVYDSLSYLRQSGWLQFGGTSAGAPQISALIALADQGRGSKGSLDGPTQTLPTIYAATTTSGTTGTETFYDVTTGSNAVASAGPGYDLVTGRGTPRKASLLYLALVNA